MAPLRAVTFGSGKELWRLPVPQTKNYSRDCDGSGFFFDGLFYIGVESGWFYALDPLKTQPWDAGKKPVVVHQPLLLGDERNANHEDDLALEASASAVGKNLYIASGAGHVYGLRRSDLAVVWDYFVGSDLNGTAVPTQKGLLLVPVEKQYIKGKGGMLALDPAKPPDKATAWFFPTGNRKVGDWAGGIIGSAAVNDEYNAGGKHPALCAFNAIDGYVYLVSQDVMAATTVAGPEPREGARRRRSRWRGSGTAAPSRRPSCSATGWSPRATTSACTSSTSPTRRPRRATPARCPARTATASYWTVTLKERDQFFTGGGFESTPTLWNGRVYVGCRDGWFYCLGDKP